MSMMAKIITYYEYALRLIGSVAKYFDATGQGKSGQVRRGRHAVGRVMRFGAVHDMK